MSDPTESQRRAAKELQMPVEEIVRIMDVWERHAIEVAWGKVNDRR